MRDVAQVCKYLYLLFDDDHVLHRERGPAYIFSTQGHIFHMPHALRLPRSELHVALIDQPDDAFSPARLRRSCPRLPWQYYLLGQKHVAINRTANAVVNGVPQALPPPSLIGRVIESITSVFTKT